MGALIAAAAYLVVAKRGTIGSALGDLKHAQPGFLALAVVSELASIACYVAVLAVILRRNPVAVPLRTVLSLTVIGIAMINSLPGGQAISTVYWYHQLTRRHVDRSAAAFTLLVATSIGIATLPLVAACGLAVPGGGYGASVRTPLLVSAAVIVGAAVLLRRRLLSAALWAVRRFAGDTQYPSPDGKQLLALFVLGFLNWLFDAGALFAALAALGDSLPFRDVIVAYSLGQLLSAIPLLPGGGGSIEATMVAGLVVAGGATTSVLAAVVLYRLIGAWGFVPIGWTLWLLTPSARIHSEPLASLATAG